MKSLAEIVRENMQEETGTLRDRLDSLVKRLWECNVTYGESVRQFKKRFLENVLQENHGNQLKVAVKLGVHRNTLSRICRELGIDPWKFHPHRYAARPNGRKPAAKVLPRISADKRGSGGAA